LTEKHRPDNGSRAARARTACGIARGPIDYPIEAGNVCWSRTSVNTGLNDRYVLSELRRRRPLLEVGHCWTDRLRMVGPGDHSGTRLPDSERHVVGLGTRLRELVPEPFRSYARCAPDFRATPNNPHELSCLRSELAGFKLAEALGRRLRHSSVDGRPGFSSLVERMLQGAPGRDRLSRLTRGPFRGEPTRAYHCFRYEDRR